LHLTLLSVTTQQKTALFSNVPEAGLIAQKIKALGGEIYLSNSVTNEPGNLFLATESEQGKAMPEGTEKLALKRVSLEEAN
jgi:hypothetical protein